MDDDQIGLELSLSRGNSYNDLTLIENDLITSTRLPIQLEEFIFENKLVVPISPNRKLTRPVSYSDSFLVCTSGSINLGNLSKPEKSGLTRFPSDQSLALLQPFLPKCNSGLDLSGIQIPESQNPEKQIYKDSQLINKLISITVHVSLISIFENIFFWQFISKSEDTALQTTIDSFLQTTLSSCQSWGNATQIIRDLFDLFVNETQINNQATAALNARSQTNYTLFVQSWMYYISLISLVIMSAIATHCKKYRIKWKEVALDNIMLVVLLGLYEYTFFKTIAMQYVNITLPELENHIINELQNQCGI
jgi:uncharacterized membrane protein YqhA